MSNFIRESKFRNIEVKVENREKYYDQLKVSTASVEGCNLLSASTKFVAFIENSSTNSALNVLSLSSTGKVHNDLRTIKVHSQAVQDFAFDIFNPSLIYTCSTDGRFKSWYISDDATSEGLEPSFILSPKSGFSLRGLSQHPSAQGIVAVRGNRDISLFDTMLCEEISSAGSGLFKNDVQAIAWSYTGHVFATTAKDKVVRLFDLRLPLEESVIAFTNGHTGTRATSATWLGDSDYFITTGHSVMMDREMLIWDQRKLMKPIKKERLDASTSPIMPFFDNDNNLLLLTGKSESNIRLYESNPITGDLYPIMAAAVGDVFRGATLLPKQLYDVMSTEVLRLLKLTESSIQPVSFTVPRKERLKFHEDLYPPTSNYAGPAFTSADYRNGLDLPPNREDITPDTRDRIATVSPGRTESPIPATSHQISMVETIDPLLSSVSSESSKSFDNNVDASQRSQLTAVNSHPEPIMEKNQEKMTPRSRQSFLSKPASRQSTSFSSMLKYRYLEGIENAKSSTFYNILPQLSHSDNPMIAASDKYWAIPYQGGGGPVYVSLLNQYGKVEPGVGVLNAQRGPIQDLGFSPFRSGLLVTGSTDNTVKIWQLPEEDCELDSLTGLSDMTPVGSLSSHTNSIKSCLFHSVIDNLLVTSSLDHTIRFNDVQTCSEVSKIDIELSSEPSYPNNMSFNYDGSLISLACKDRTIRIVDPRLKSSVLTTPVGGPLGRNLTAVWCYSGRNSNAILSTSAAISGTRQIHIWDVRTMNEPLSTQSIDNAAGQIIPMFDEDTGMCILAGKGDTSIRFYEMTLGSEGAVCLKSCEYLSGKDPLLGICQLPKRLCNVREVEILKFLKLTMDSVIPITFRVPRSENLKAYFQDDLFPPNRSKTPGGDLADWLKWQDDELSLPDPVFDSLKPEGMINCSQRPVEVQQKRQSTIFREEIEKQEAEKLQRDETFSKLQSLAIQRSKYHPNTSNTSSKVKGEVKPTLEDNASDEDEWET